jgi:hypothetical protein
MKVSGRMDVDCKNKRRKIGRNEKEREENEIEKEFNYYLSLGWIAFQKVFFVFIDLVTKLVLEWCFFIDWESKRSGKCKIKVSGKKDV